MNLNLHLIPLAFTALFPVINPIGTSFILYSMSGRMTTGQRKRMSFYVAMYAFFLNTFFLFFGAEILKIFGLNIPSIQIAGGLIIASMGWKLLNSNDDDEDHNAKNPEIHDDADKSSNLPPKPDQNKWFYPFTFPITIGPGGMSVALTLSAHTKGNDFFSMDRLAVLIGVLAVSVVLYFCLAYLKIISAKLSPSANLALSKIFAFLVVCIGAEIVSSGATSLLQSIKL